ncbi:MAG: thioredoxin family protein, partial [Myxococcota bacterium]
GLFSMQLPSGLNTRLSQVGGHTAFGALGMGVVSGLIAAPCTGPVLAVILTIIAASGAVSVGLVLMLAFSFGLGLPFLVLAISSSALQRVPSGGPWMELVKFVLATAMFVVAFYFVQLGWPGLGTALRAITYATWLGVVLVFAALMLIAWYLALLARGAGRLLKPVSVALLTLGTVLVLLGGPASPAAADAPGIDWVVSHDQGLAKARARQAPILVDFTADWGLACKELDRHTYTDARVRAEAKRFVAIKIDATETNDEIDRLFALYDIRGLPAVIFIDAQGNVLEDPRVSGFVPADRFLSLMHKVR